MTTELFKKRLSTFYSSWRIYNKYVWENSDVVVISAPPKTSNLRSSQVFLWLFGEDLADTTVIFTPSSIYFLCTQMSFSRLRSLGGYASEVMKIPVSVELKPMNDTGISKLDTIFRSVWVSLNPGKSVFAADHNRPLTVGRIDDEMPELNLLLNCVNYFDNYVKYRIVSVSFGVEMLLLPSVQSAAEVSGSRIDSLAVELHYNRGVKRTIEDIMDALDLTKVPLMPCSRGHQSVLLGYEGKKEIGGVLNKNEASPRLLMELQQKLTLFYSSWRKYRKELWGGSDVLVVSTSPSMSMGSSHHSISSSFYSWLLGHEFPDTTAVFMDQAIDFICPNENFPRLCSLGPKITKAAQVSVSIQQKAKVEDELELVDATLYALRKRQASHLPVIIGYIDGESPNSKVLDCCGSKLDERRFQSMNVISCFVSLINEGEESKSLQRQCLDTILKTEIKQCNAEHNVIEQLAESYHQQMSLMNCNNAKAASVISNELQNDELLKEKHEYKNVMQLLEEVDNNLPTQFAQMNILVEEECNSSNAQQVVQEDVVSEDDWEIIERHHEGQGQDIGKDSSWRSWIGTTRQLVRKHLK